jgi:hypothetical protein
MQNLRIHIVAGTDLDSNQKSALSKLLKETYYCNLDAGKNDILNIVTVDAMNSVFSGKSLKPSNFTFEIMSFVPGLSLLIPGVEPLTLFIKGTALLYSVFESMKLKIDEKECFILFALHNNEKKALTVDEALKLLESEWKVYPEQSMSASEFEHALRKLSKSKIIEYRDNSIYLIEKVVVRYK